MKRRLTLRRIMKEWRAQTARWKERAKAHKEALKQARPDLRDDDIAAALTELRFKRYPGRSESKNTVTRGTVNSWLNQRDCNVEDFLDLCEVIDADPCEILFGPLKLEAVSTKYGVTRKNQRLFQRKKKPRVVAKKKTS